MPDQHTDTSTTITGAAPSVAVALQRAADIAAEHGRNWFGVEDLLAALLTGSTTPLHVHWQRRGLAALSFTELRDFATSLVPVESPRRDGTREPAKVAFTASGPLEAEYTALVEQA
ncbi:hypothetical protein BOX37_03820 [Nocardia mangyaensis]|uniref:Uncharacterized protein n=1 Tax=Nocardia mangyaensis TaxID=2213200 RepID=A0A1J0VMJ9_9NOCA|nr:hypothetical protein [Nocardia mangyaensis]APE33238.1 hypothetical protein BOX37_03820 [Nocardia mangyaensis]